MTLETVLSKFIEAMMDVRHLKIDDDLLYYYQWGLVVGILVITTLSFFPGVPVETWQDDSKKGEKQTLDSQGKSTAGDADNEQFYQDADKFAFWTPHQKLNAAVYLIMFLVFLFVLNVEYGGALGRWIQWKLAEQNILQF